MNFNKHSNLEGQHAFLGASKYHWINYSEDKVAEAYSKFLATQKGTVLHAFAAQCISLGQKLPKSQKTLNMYVNDAIGFKMTPEQVLYYSDNCFGTADAILFRNGLLRIHDLKTGQIPAHMEQLEIYAALFCLEYKVKPGDIEMELRLYQNNEILYHNPTAEDIVPIMDKIITFDKVIELFEDDEFIDWLLNVIFDGFKVDVSYMSDDEYASCLDEVFNKLEYRKIPKNKLTGEKFMEKSVNMGDQLSQAIGIYYPHRIDNYVKYVRGIKFYGRYSDDWYIMSPSKEELLDLLENIERIAHEYGIHINMKKTRIVKISGTYKFLQIKYTLTESGKIMKRINPDRVYTMRRKLKKLAVKVENGEIPYENVEGMFKGWMGDFYKLMSRTQRKDLLELYEGLFNKTITIVKKKMIIKDRSQQESTQEVA